MPNTPVIRPAQAADSDALAPLIYSSGPAAFDYVFLNRAQDFLASTLPSGKSAFGFQSHWVAADADGGRPLGSISLYTRADHEAHNSATIAAIARWASWRAPLVLMRGLRVEALIPLPPAGSLHIAHLGVLPEMRSQGIGEHLINFARERARQAGIAALSLDVSAGNPRAQQLYERLGFCAVREQQNTIPGLSDHRFMVLALD